MSLVTALAELCFALAKLCLAVFLVCTISVPAFYVLKALRTPAHDRLAVTTSLSPSYDSAPTPIPPPSRQLRISMM